MVVHDLRNPTDSIREGLEQAQVIMHSTLKEIVSETNTFFTKKVLVKGGTFSKKGDTSSRTL